MKGIFQLVQKIIEWQRKVLISGRKHSCIPKFPNNFMFISNSSQIPKFPANYTEECKSQIHIKT